MQKSVGLPEPVLSVRIGRPQWSPPLSRCLQRRRDSELEGLTNSGSFMQMTIQLSCNDKETGRRPNAIPVFFGRLVPPADLCRTNVLLMDMLFIYNRNYNIFN